MHGKQCRKLYAYQISSFQTFALEIGQRSATQTMPQHVFCCMLPDNRYGYDIVGNMAEHYMDHIDTWFPPYEGHSLPLPVCVLPDDNTQYTSCWASLFLRWGGGG